MGAYDFSIDVDLVARLRQVLPLSAFVETGTFEGEAVTRMLPFFDELHTIELAPGYHAAAVERFRPHPNVTAHLGDSGDVLRKLRPTLADRSVLYWLDAHWCVADETAGATSQCPLLDELEAIASLNAESAVLIDDARLFLATPPAPHEVGDWPRFRDVIEKLLALGDAHDTMIVNDVIVLYPESCRDAVSEYARSRGVDVLAETHRLRTLERECEVQTQAAADRLALIEQLKADNARLEREAAQRRASPIARVKSWTKPRIGRLKHYEPKSLRVPERYLSERPPEPAPTISIVTPSYQQGRYLDRTIYSVISQGYPALEYVVQDGGSIDATLEVLQRFDPFLTRWASEADGGQADAINRGFAATNGEIMGWLNSDDLLLPGALAYVARYFVEHPDVDVVYGNRLMIDDNDGQIGAWILPPHDDLALTLADFVPQETLFWRRRIWEAAGGGVDSSFHYALDWDLLLRFRDAEAKIVRLPRYLGAFRVHDEQKTTVEDVIGRDEVARLRERVHGRPVPVDEVLRRLKPYLLRHIAVHSWWRAADRIPQRWVEVRTTPTEPWLRPSDAAAAQQVRVRAGS